MRLAMPWWNGTGTGLGNGGGPPDGDGATGTLVEFWSVSFMPATLRSVRAQSPYAESTRQRHRGEGYQGRTVDYLCPIFIQP